MSSLGNLLSTSAIDIALDDILARSNRLEKRIPFEVDLPLQEITKDSQQIMGKIDDSEEVRVNGQLLLAEKKIDITKTFDLLKQVKKKVYHKQQKILSFNDQTEDTLQSNIVSSISKTQTKTDFFSDNFIFDTIADQWEEDEAIHHISTTQFKETGTGFSIPIVRQKTQFFITYLSLKDSEYAELLSRHIRNPDEYPFTLSTPLADTLQLIGLIQSHRGDKLESVLEFLQRQCLQKITEEVNQSKYSSMRGGLIGKLYTIEEYVNRHFDIQNYWCVLYYLLRTGCFQEANEFTESHTEEFPLFVINGLKLSKFSSVDDAKIQEYRATELVNEKANPYKLIVLSYILREKPTLRDSKRVMTSVEDWIWLRLHVKGAQLSDLAKEFNNPDDYDEGQQNPFLWGQILIMSSQYEEACKWFISQEDNIDENTHIAIALHVSNLVDSKSVSKTILKYAEQLFKSESREDKISAIKYISKIQDREERIKTCAELAVYVDEGPFMFMMSDEGEYPPIQYSLSVEDQQECLRKAGEESEERDQHNKAALFFMLSGDYNRLISSICVELRQCIEGYLNTSTSNSYDSLQLAIDVYDNIKDKVDVQELETMRSLIYLAAAKDNMDKGNFEEASRFLEQSEMFPRGREQVSEYIEKIRVSPQEKRRVYPKALEIAMHAYSELFKIVPPDNQNITSFNQFKQAAKEQVDALLELSGSIDIEINKETQFRILSYYNVFK